MEIKKFAVTDHKIKAVVYGSSGTGKTSFGGTAKKAIFASAEGGLLAIADKQPNYVEIKSLNDLKELLSYLRNEKHDYETVIIDSITEINEIIKADIEKKTGKAMQLQDWGTLAKEIKIILRGFRDLPMHVLFIAQETNEKDGDIVTKVVPSLNGKAATEIAYFMDIVGYLYIEKGTGARKLITLPNSMYLTKDRSKVIGNDTPADFSVWVEKISGIALGKEETVASYSTTPAQPVAQPAVKQPPQMPAFNPAQATPARQGSLLLNTAKSRIETMDNIEHLRAAMTNVDAMTKLDAEQKEDLRAFIAEKIEAIELTNFDIQQEEQDVPEMEYQEEEENHDAVLDETHDTPAPAPKKVKKTK